MKTSAGGAAFVGCDQSLGLVLAIFLLLLASSSAASKDAASAPKGPERVVFIGDSITHFWDLAATFPGHKFINKGVSGQTTIEIRARFEADVIAEHPDKVVILAGTNDIILKADSLDEVVGNLEHLAGNAREHGIQPIVCTIPPQWPDITGIKPEYKGNHNPDIDALNFKIKQSPILNGRVCDYHSALTEPGTDVVLPGTLLDGVHPVCKGYQLMAPVISVLLHVRPSRDCGTDGPH